MSRARVVITDYVFPNLDPEAEVFAGLDVDLVAGQSKTKADVLALVPGADAMLNTYFGPIDGEIMDAMPTCRVIVRYGVGVDTIDIPAATARGIMVVNVPDYCIDEVSDHAVAMLLALARKLPLGDRRVRAGDWAIAPLKPVTSLHGMSVGLVGMGRIGREIARKLAAFNPVLSYFDPYAAGDASLADYISLSFDALLADCDAIILQAPSTPETHHLLSDAAFAAMKRRPIVINCARGDLIDTDALVRALQSGQVSAAGLDVIEGANPPADHPLFAFDSVLLTPHSAWLSEQALYNLQRFTAMEVARVLRGERPKSLLNPEVLK